MKPRNYYFELEELLVRFPQVAYVDACISDLHNVIRGKRYSVRVAEKIYTTGVQFPESVFLLDSQGESDDPCGRGFSDGDPDGTLFPIEGMTKFIPWGAANKIQVFTQLYTDDGTPCDVDPRVIAANVIDKFSQLGYQPNVAFELEFYLLDSKYDAQGRPQFLRQPNSDRRNTKTQVYLLEDLDNHLEFLDALNDAFGIQGVPASVTTSEYAPCQYEINLDYVNDPLLAADHCILLRNIVKGVAASLDMRATFMAKPFLDLPGNGAHIHLSLQDEYGNNVFCDSTKTGNLKLQNAVGGLMSTMSDFMAIMAPVRNSYRRFAPNMFVPINRTWGYNNRSVTVRISGGSNKSRRLEHRIAGADANPYLLLAAVLAGVHYGLKNEIDPGPASNLVNRSDTIDQSLPLECCKAIEMFKHSEIAKQYISKEYIDLYCAVNIEELAKFEKHISAWEYQLYL